MERQAIRAIFAFITALDAAEPNMTRLRILIWLADSDGGRSIDSLSALAKKLGRDRRTVRVELESLMVDGVIEMHGGSYRLTEVGVQWMMKLRDLARGARSDGLEKVFEFIHANNLFPDQVGDTPQLDR